MQPEQEIIAQALRDVAARDSELDGAIAKKWYLIVEHETHDEDDESERFVSVFRSPEIQPWDALGLLSFARAIENSVATGE